MTARWLSTAVYGLTLVVVTAALTHLGTVLALPYRSASDAYTRLSALAGGVPLKPVSMTPAAFGPDQDPALMASVCLFDLGQGPVAVALDVAAADFAALSVHDRYGRTLSGLTNRSASQNRLAIVVLTSAQAARRPATPEGGLTEIRVESAEPQGFVTAQWLAGTPSETSIAQRGVARLSCRPA